LLLDWQAVEDIALAAAPDLLVRQEQIGRQCRIDRERRRATGRARVHASCRDAVKLPDRRAVVAGKGARHCRPVWRALVLAAGAPRPTLAPLDRGAPVIVGLTGVAAPTDSVTADRAKRDPLRVGIVPPHMMAIVSKEQGSSIRAMIHEFV
jgi:hypothetical protein